jgi:putative ABC transport system substrate-binding protein
MKTKIFVYALPALILVTIHLVEAQQPKKVPQIGYVASGYGPGRQLEALRQGLRDLGYIEGKNILIEGRYLEGNLVSYPKICGRTRTTQS